MSLTDDEQYILIILIKYYKKETVFNKKVNKHCFQMFFTTSFLRILDYLFRFGLTPYTFQETWSNLLV